MYSSLLCRHCESGEMVRALKAWLRASKQGLLLSEKEYAALLRCARKVGDAIVMERVLSDLAEDVLVPSRVTCRIIVEWFQSPAAIVTKNKEERDESGKASKSEIPSLLREFRVPYPPEVTNDSSMGPVQTEEENGWIINDDCQVDDAGVMQSGCLKGACLKPVTTSQQAWEEMIRMNEQIGKKSSSG